MHDLKSFELSSSLILVISTECPTKLSESYALTDETADRIRLPQLWQIIKKRGNKKKASWDKSKKPVKEPTIYDENGMRIIFHDFEEADADNESEENDDDEDEDDEESDNEGEEDEEMEGGEMEEIDEEEDEKERSKAELLIEQNLRIKENNKREEEISRQKDLDRKKGRSIIVRTLSGILFYNSDLALILFYSMSTILFLFIFCKLRFD